MKVKVDDKTYCVETLIADNERLRKDVIASAEYHRLILDEIRAEIERDAFKDVNGSKHISVNRVNQILNKYKVK